ncbi:hypothetical protein FOL47_009125 [Perkinsus chesapeaki]|uniref:Uncharacterized protein n=1 Tax=Perkinsus chesapeaki TaxID=330153 RepID=A0A7J6LAG3_PERCH|nr:hypothetical protein FOL47_009125 [Perkinsus chesapeaki]
MPHQVAIEAATTDVLHPYGVNITRILSHWFYRSLYLGSRSPSMHRYTRRVPELDAFISHPWAQSAGMKYFALSLRYNCYSAYIITLLAAFLLSLLRVRAEAAIPLVWVMLVLGMSGFGKLSIGQPMVFFDQFCIPQDDKNAMLEGIMNIGHYVERSKRLTVLWSREYNRRLWCMFELASFIKRRGISNVEICPVAGAKVALMLVNVSYLYLTFRFFFNLTAFDWIVDYTYSALYVIYWCFFYLPERCSMHRYFRTVDTKHLSCLKDSDRIMLMGRIEELYGSFTNFEDHVRDVFHRLQDQWHSSAYVIRLLLVTTCPFVTVAILTGKISTILSIVLLRVTLQVLLIILCDASMKYGMRLSRWATAFCCLPLIVAHGELLRLAWKMGNFPQDTTSPSVSFWATAVVFVMVAIWVKRIIKPVKNVENSYDSWMCPEVSYGT